MKRIPPDPERPEQHRDELSAFAADPPYPVFGLRRPVVVPAFLAECQSSNDVVVGVTLAYGDSRDTGGPFVMVTTEPPGSADLPGDPLPALRREIDDGKLPRTQSPPVRERVAGGELCRVGAAWALRTAVGDQAVTVLGHGPAPEDVEVGPVQELPAYVAARYELIARRADELRALPEPVLPPASGVAAVRVFLETFVPGGPDAGAAYRALGRRAVAELDRVLGCGAEQAEHLVYSMVDQLTQLRLRVPWFTAQDGPREAALEEMLRYYGLRQPVSSEEALLQWDRYWDGQARAEPPGAAQELADWVAAWTRWPAQREADGPLE